MVKETWIGRNGPIFGMQNRHGSFHLTLQDRQSHCFVKAIVPLAPPCKDNLLPYCTSRKKPYRDLGEAQIMIPNQATEVSNVVGG
jgi:hypothetical protein